MDVAFGKTVTLIRCRLEGYDDMGSPVYSEIREPIENSVVVPQPGTEDSRSSSDTATDRFEWHAPAGTMAGVSDLAVVDGETFEVDSRPLDYGVHAITGTRGRVTIQLVRHT